MKKYFTALAIFATVTTAPFSASAEQPHQSSITFQQPYAAGDSTFDFAASKLDGIEAINVASSRTRQIDNLNRRIQSLQRKLRDGCRSRTCKNSTNREITRLRDQLIRLTDSLISRFR